MSNKLRDSDKAASSKYAEGFILEWDLLLRTWRRDYRKRNGCAPPKQMEDDYFAVIANKTEWVPDPEFGQSVSLSENEIDEIGVKLKGQPNLLRQFNKFLQKHAAPQPLFKEAY